MVHYQSLSSLSEAFKSARKLTESAILKLGIDGGGSFLKVSFTHIVLEEDETPPKNPVQKTIKLMSPPSTKATSVKQQILKAQNTPESYHNVKAILNLIQVQEECQKDSFFVEYSLTAASIHVVGVMTHHQISKTVGT